MPSSAPRPRPLGGFNSGFGNFSDEHLDESAFQQAAQQKGLAQQATNAAQATTGGSALQAGGGATLPPGALPSPGAEPPTPRELGTIPEELVVRPVQDVVAGIKSLFDINALLNIDPVKDDPQTQARKQQQLSRWQKLNTEQQEYAQKLYQQKMQKKKQEEEERQAKKQQEEQRKAQSLEVPSGPQKGPVGPGGSGKSSKQSAIAKMQNDRKTLGGPASAN